MSLRRTGNRLIEHLRWFAGPCRTSQDLARVLTQPDLFHQKASAEDRHHLATGSGLCLATFDFYLATFDFGLATGANSAQ